MDLDMRRMMVSDVPTRSLTGAERAHGTALGREDGGGGGTPGRSSSVTMLLLARRVNAHMGLLLY